MKGVDLCLCYYPLHYNHKCKSPLIKRNLSLIIIKELHFSFFKGLHYHHKCKGFKFIHKYKNNDYVGI